MPSQQRDEPRGRDPTRSLRATSPDPNSPEQPASASFHVVVAGFRKPRVQITASSTIDANFCTCTRKRAVRCAAPPHAAGGTSDEGPTLGRRVPPPWASAASGRSTVIVRWGGRPSVLVGRAAAALTLPCWSYPCVIRVSELRPVTDFGIYRSASRGNIKRPGSPLVEAGPSSSLSILVSHLLELPYL